MLIVLRDKMAKQIRSTPTLRGKDAIRFIENMIKEEKTPNPVRVNFIEESLKMKFKVY